MKSFLFGIFTAYGIYCITRKGNDGKSILDELLDKPADFMQKAKDYAEEDLVQLIKKEWGK